MIRNYFHRWEQRLAEVSKAERLVRPFEWGDDWIDAGRSARGDVAGEHRGRDQEENDEHVAELGEESSPQRHARLRRQLVGAVAVEPRAGLRPAEAALGVRPLRGHHGVNRVPVRGRGIAGTGHVRLKRRASDAPTS